MSSLTPRGSTRAWRKLRALVLSRDGYRCHWCGKPATTVDHLVRRVDGGSDALDNLAAACGPCNYGRRVAVRRVPPSHDW